MFVYFSRGRAFFDLDLDSGRYGRFLAGDTHPPGTGKVTVTGFVPMDYKGFAEVLVPLGGDASWAVAVVADEDIGQLWEAVDGGWHEQTDFESPSTWAPATLLVTGPDGALTAELDAGDYLFCAPFRLTLRRTEFGDCTYEDVTAGQDRVLYLMFRESSMQITELTEQSSVALVRALTACGTPQQTVSCASRAQYERARQQYEDTGDWPDDW